MKKDNKCSYNLQEIDDSLLLETNEKNEFASVMMITEPV
jgi:hypothetical protein